MTPPPGRGHPRPAVVLVAHGSRDPRAAAATEALAGAVGRARPEWSVHASYLDHAGERPLHVLHRLSASGCRRAVLVPVLLTAAYHGKVDVPEVLREARAGGLPMDLALADVLGPSGALSRSEAAAVPGLLLDALIRRLPEGDLDAVVLAAAGTRDAAARTTVEAVAVALGERLGLPCTVAYASAAPPTAGEAVEALRHRTSAPAASGPRAESAADAAASGPQADAAASVPWTDSAADAAASGLRAEPAGSGPSAGPARIGVASYFLAPGRLYDAAMASAREAGAVVFAEPLGDVPELVALTASRAEAALSRRPLSNAA